MPEGRISLRMIKFWLVNNINNVLLTAVVGLYHHGNRFILNIKKAFKTMSSIFITSNCRVARHFRVSFDRINGHEDINFIHPQTHLERHFIKSIESTNKRLMRASKTTEFRGRGEEGVGV